MKRILITGASGFIGRVLTDLLVQNKYSLILQGLHSHEISGINCSQVDLGNTKNDLAPLLQDIDVVIHLAGLAHVRFARQSAEQFTKINAEGTRRLAEAAVVSGVKRFIFLSSIKVHGNTNPLIEGVHQAFTEDSPANPEDDYASSKWQAEEYLRQICHDSELDYVILRPPLVYGPEVKANFLRLIDTVAKGLPLPLASIHNQRSMIYVDNLCHVITKCIGRPEVKNQVYLVSDIEISLPDLITKIGKLLGKKTLLFPFPVYLLTTAFRLAGKRELVDRLCGSLLLDNSKMVNELQMLPIIAFDDALKETIEWYKKSILN